MSVFQWVVSSEEEGMTLHAFLRKKVPDAPSVKGLKRAIEGRACQVNGKVETFASHPLKRGNRVEFDGKDLFHVSKPELITILYQDDALVICDKRAGDVSDEKELRGKLPSFHPPLQLVHRLDKETSGVLILAKQRLIKEKMIEIFRDHNVHKFYLALVDGKVKRDHGEVDLPLQRSASGKGQAVVRVDRSGKGQAALTRWKCLGRGKDASLLLCEPITGRTHQLRVHLSHIGHPILGDLQYGKHVQSTYRAKRHLLHAYEVCFPHPLTGKALRVKAPLPQDLQEALQALEMAHLIELFGKKE